jgi:hypothetical protein
MTRIQLISPFEGYLDVADGTNFPVTKSVSDIKDLSKRKSDITKTCILAGTDNNNRLLGNFFNVNIVANEFNPNVKVLCNVIQDELPVMENAYLQLLSINKSSQSNGTADQEIEYEVVLSSSRANLFQIIKQKEVKDIDFSEFNHRYTRDNILATSGNTWEDGYKYHRAFKGDTSGIYLTDFKAGVFFKTVFDKIHEAAGFEYEFDEMSATTFEKLFIPYSGPQPKMSQQDIDLYTSRSSNTGGTVTINPQTNLNGTMIGNNMYQYPIATDNEILDNSNSYNPATAIYTAQLPVRYFAVVYIDYDVVLSSATDAYMVADQTYATTQVPVGIKHRTFLELYKNGNIGAGISTAVASNQAPEIFYTVNDGNIQAGVPKTVGSYNGRAELILPNNQPLDVGDTLAVHLKTNWRPGSGGINSVEFVTTPGGTTAATVNYEVKIKAVDIRITPIGQELGFNQTVVMNNFLPNKLKQIDVLNTFLKLYNIYSIDNPDDPNTIIYKTRDNYYDSGAEQDWTDIFAVDRPHTIKLLSEVQNKKLILKYKDDSKDIFTSEYKAITSESYGQVEYTFDNEFTINEQVIEIPPSTTAMVQDGYGDVVPSFLMSNPECEWRLLLDNDWIPCQGNGWNFIERTPSDAITFNTYPSIHHWDDPNNPTVDIYFGVNDYYPYLDYTITNNNAFNQYWRRTVNNWNVGKVMEAWFEITPSLFNRTKLNDRVFINDAWWNIVEIKDYNANADNQLTKVVLISVDDDIKFNNFISVVPAVVNPSDPIIGRPIKEIMAREIVNSNNFTVGSFGSTVNGVNNVVNGRYNVVLGDDSIVTGEKSMIIGDNNTTSLEKKLIVGDNLEVTDDEYSAHLKNAKVYEDLEVNGTKINSDGIESSILYFEPGYFEEEYYAVGEELSLKFSSGDTIDITAPNINLNGDVNIDGLTIGGGDIVFVSQKSDFPSPNLSNIIQLEDEVTYFITGTIDLSGLRLIGGSNTTIIGGSSENSILTSTGLSAGTALLSSIYTTPIRHIAINNVGIAVDFDGTTNPGDVALDWTGVNFVNVPSIGNIKNVSNFIFDKGALLNSKGLKFDGTIGTVGLNNSLFQGDGLVGNIIEVMSSCTITRRFRTTYSSVVSLSGNTGIDVSTGATIPIEAYILDTVNFAGAGTYISGIDNTFNEALFINCVGITNTSVNGQMYMRGNAVATTITGTTNFVKVAGVTTASTENEKYVMTDNRLTNQATISRKYLIQCTLSFNAGNNNVCEFGFYDSKLGAVREPSITPTTANAAGRAENASLSCIVQHSSGDYIEIWTKNTSSATDITVSNMNVIITEFK